MPKEYKVGNLNVPTVMLQDFLIQAKGISDLFKVGKTLVAIPEEARVAQRASLDLWTTTTDDYIDIRWWKPIEFREALVVGYRSTARIADDRAAPEQYGDAIISSRDSSGSYKDYVDPDTTYYYTFFVLVDFNSARDAITIGDKARALFVVKSWITHRYGFSAFTGRIESNPSNLQNLEKMLQTTRVMHEIGEWTEKLNPQEKDRYQRAQDVLDRAKKFKEFEGTIDSEERDRMSEVYQMQIDDTQKQQLSLEITNEYVAIRRQVRHVFMEE